VRSLVGDILDVVEDERRESSATDRRAHRRGGRRDGDARKAWYLRRRIWLALASVAFVGWRRVRALGRRQDHDIAA
jgi:hypothetical protein